MHVSVTPPRDGGQHACRTRSHLCGRGAWALIDVHGGFYSLGDHVSRDSMPRASIIRLDSRCDEIKGLVEILPDLVKACRVSDGDDP